MKVAAFDVETHRIQPGLLAPPIVCGSIADDTGAHLLTRLETLTWITHALRDATLHIIGINIVFDLGCVCAADPSLTPWVFRAFAEGRIHDLGIREALIDIARGDLIEHKAGESLGQRYGATILAKRYLGIDLKTEKQNGWRERYAELEDVPQEEWPWDARRYPMRDVALPLVIFHKQEGGPNLHNEAEQARGAWALHLMSLWGLRTNRERTAALRARVQATDRASTIEFQKAGLLRADGSENQQALRTRITAAYDGAPPQTPTGLVATDRDTLAESGDELLERYAIAGKNDKYLTTYLPILEQGVDQPWNPQFNVLVASTRVSSDAQQFPQYGGVRECFESRPGTAYCSVDYPGLELRTMSQRAVNEVGFSKMADAMRTGLDPHLIAAASFSSCSYDDAKKRNKAGDAAMKAFRDLGKIYNFGKGGGMGPGAMVFNARAGKKGETTKSPSGVVYIGTRFCILTGRAAACGVKKVVVSVQGKKRRICSECLEAAKMLDGGWLRAWPEQRALFDLASRVTANGLVTVEIPESQVKRGRCGYTQFLNTPFQGLGAVATKRAMWRISFEMYCAPDSPLFGSRLVLNVHDELIAELLDDCLTWAADRMALIMREELEKVVPDLVGCTEVEPALSRFLSKNAKTIRDERGRLEIWQEAA